ncbi:ABC transporter G family member 39-like, partial [Dendrobium catenatum]|uniref:ABC transporter G family member 39-like n=1 Tax=Dendrobium catenatum TaxID=906689 RepID=UPI00109FD979
WPTPSIAVARRTDCCSISTAFYAVWNIFAGYLIPRPRIPVWWRWYSWACPVAWTLYGLVASQFGDYDQDKMTDSDVTVREFIKEYFGFRHDFLGAIAAAMIGFTVLFAFVFAFSIKVLNFQRR